MTLYKHKDIPSYFTPKICAGYHVLIEHSYYTECPAGDIRNQSLAILPRHHHPIWPYTIGVSKTSAVPVQKAHAWMVQNCHSPQNADSVTPHSSCSWDHGSQAGNVGKCVCLQAECKTATLMVSSHILSPSREHSAFSQALDSFAETAKLCMAFSATGHPQTCMQYAMARLSAHSSGSLFSKQNPILQKRTGKTKP